MRTQPHARPARKSFRVNILAVLCAALLAAVPAAAQQAGSVPTVTLKGRVIDTSSGQTLPHARIEVTDLRLRTAADGRGEFELQLPAGSHIVRVHELGYDTLSEVWTATVDDAGLVVELAPRPLLLEAIQATGRRLEARIERLSVQARAFEGDQIRRSGHPWTLDFLAMYAGLVPIACDDRDVRRMSCAWVRGGPQLVSVFVDDVPALPGLDELRTLPMHDIYRIEVIAGGAQVRVYSKSYINRLVRTGAPLAIIPRHTGGFGTIPDAARRRAGRRGN